MIELRLLGPPSATVDGEPAPPELLWRKHLALTAYLALSPDRRASRSRLAGLLWGDKPEKAARGSLAEALRILRGCTDDGVEDAGAGFIRLADGTIETDTDRFLTRIEADDPVAAAGLVRGELLEGLAIPDAWEFEEWLAGQRRSWRARSEEALVAAAGAVLAAGRPADAYRLGQRALDFAPTSEAACRVGMKCLCLTDDRGRALELFERFAEHLRDELGIEPSEETVALAERVREQRSWQRPVAVPDRSARGAESRRTPLMGRGAELETLVGEWQACLRTGSARIAVIAGDPGTGRTRLLEELLARARLDGAATAVVRAVAADHDADGAVLAALVHATERDPDARGPDLDDQLRDAASGSPLMLAVDDADWADSASLNELERIASRVTDAPILLALVTGRRPGREALTRLCAELGSDMPGALVSLDRLGYEPMRELTAWAVPDYDDAGVERLTRRVAADTAGYPLLAVELLHAVAHGLSPEDSVGSWPETGRTLDQTLPGDLPDTLVAAIRVGFRVLTDAAQQALSAVAVLEPPASPERIARATGLGEAALADALDELEWEHWLVADARGYTFLAPLVRDVVARDMVTEGQKRRMLERT
ncbi:MAG: BTAD domain-containing putative transcriptional regulator [Candidatus Longimicrobiales bacterium M2_2A_002]